MSGAEAVMGMMAGVMAGMAMCDDGAPRPAWRKLGAQQGEDKTRQSDAGREASTNLTLEHTNQSQL